MPTAVHHEEEQADLYRNRNIVIRASADYLQWLDRLCVAARCPKSVLVDMAIARYAAGINFESPPRR